METKLFVQKKNGSIQKFNKGKIITAVSKSAARAMINLTETDYDFLCNEVVEFIVNNSQLENDRIVITIEVMHLIMEKVLTEHFPLVAKSYKEYRNWKIDFANILDKVYQKAQSISYIGDVTNANTDSTMISTQRSLVYGELNKQLYKKFFLTKEEKEAIEDGYIYIHDMKDRRDGINCCLCDIGNLLDGGFEMGNVWYNEPKTLDVAFDVISDVTLSMASQQYGGFTLPRVDTVLKKYAEKSYQKYYKKYFKLIMSDKRKTVKSLGFDWDSLSEDTIKELWIQADELAKEEAENDVRRDFEQGFQSWEYRFNTVGSSRGDYPFVAISFGIDTDKFALMASEMALKVRKKGQGKEDFKKQVLFPKLTFLYDEELHGTGKPYEWLFDTAIDCSSESMYPDYLSLTGKGYIPSMYKKYGKVVSLMGCRASLSPWYERGGIKPADENDVPIFEGRCNLGAITLNLIMILAKARKEERDFYEVLEYYLEMIRNLHKRTFDYLGEKKASTNPLAWMQGGLLNGYLNANDVIRPLLYPMTMSFGITGLNELQQLYNQKSLIEDGDFAYEVMVYINERVNQFKEEDGLLYAIYGTPAESLAGTQVRQFREKYDIVKNVSDKPYVSNSFHCHVSERISPIQKQDIEERFWDLFNGGKIQYCRYPLGYNKIAIKALVKRAMDKGFYEGVNLDLCYCEECGYKQVEMKICPKCGSKNLTIIDRMNGYLGYTRVKGDTRFNDDKLAEINDRVSM